MEEELIVQQPQTPFVGRFYNQLDHYKKLLLKYWWLPLLTFAISLGAQWSLLKRVPPVFASTGQMIVNVKLSIPAANTYLEDMNNFLGTQVLLMQDAAVVNRVKYELRTFKPELPAGPVDINVALLPKSGIFNLRATGQDPGYTQAYLQETMDEYVQLKRDLIENASASAQSNMTAKLKELGAELQKSKDEVNNYQSNNPSIFLQPSGGNSAADYLSTLTRKLAERKSELKTLEMLSLDENLERQQGLFEKEGPAAQATDANTTPFQQPQPQPQQPANTGSQPNPNTPSPQQPNTAPTPVKHEVARHNMPPNLGELEMAYLQAKQQIIELKAKRDIDLSKGLSPKSFVVWELNDQIATQEKLLEDFKEESQEQLINRKHILKSEIQTLEAEVQEWERKALDASRKLAIFESLKETQRRLQLRFDEMQTSLQTLDVDKGIGQESVTVLQQATPAEFVPPQKGKRLAMAALMGLFVGIGIIVLIDRLNDRPSSPTELEQLFPMPVLGLIPLMKPKGRKREVPILQLEDDRYPLIEAYRSFRSALLYKDISKEQPPDQSRSIVITSACPSDGKSMVSANFAITLAQAGSRVLLIDADLRRGVMHKHFSVPSSPGLAEVLSGKCEWAKTVVPTSFPNLDLIPCGRSPHHSVNLFASPGKLLRDIAAGHYDYYLFDTAPVMVGDDVLSLAPNVDGLIMVIRAGATSGRITQAALRLLHQRHVNVIGLVFNAVNPKASDYYYYRFKDYYPPPAAIAKR